MYWHYRWGMGTGGFHAETGGYGLIASRIPTIYATFYRNMMGHDVSPHQDVAAVMVRRLIQSALTTDKKRHRTVKLSSATGLSGGWFAYNFPIIDPQYQPMVLTAWNHLAGVNGPASMANVLLEKSDGVNASLTNAMILLIIPTPCNRNRWTSYRSVGAQNLVIIASATIGVAPVTTLFSKCMPRPKKCAVGTIPMPAPFASLPSAKVGSMVRTIAWVFAFTNHVYCCSKIETSIKAPLFSRRQRRQANRQGIGARAGHIYRY